MAVPHQIEHTTEPFEIADIRGKLVADATSVLDFKVGQVELGASARHQTDTGSASCKANCETLANAPAGAGDYYIQSLDGIRICCHGRTQFYCHSEFTLASVSWTLYNPCDKLQRMIRLVAVFAILQLALNAAKPAPEDQMAVQELFRTYIKAVNDCDPAGVASVITNEFYSTGPGMGSAAGSRFKPVAQFCEAPNRAKYELSATARVVIGVTSEVIIADAYFRTVVWPEGEKSGRIYLTFVKREGIWKLINLRLHPFQFEKPLVAVQVAATHDSPGPDGWVNLFDGSSAHGFIDIGGGPIPPSWTIEDGLLRAVAGKGGRALRTRDTYRSFELKFEWKAPPKGNSGIKYHLYYLNDGRGSDGTGREYQIADDEGDPGAIQFPVERTGGLYNQFAPKGAKPRPLGEFNESAIIVRGRHCEHWLNGVKVLEYESESGPLEGPLVLQHHTTNMWFRNIRIKRLD